MPQTRSFGLVILQYRLYPMLGRGVCLKLPARPGITLLSRGDLGTSRPPKRPV